MAESVEDQQVGYIHLSLNLQAPSKSLDLDQISVVNFTVNWVGTPRATPSITAKIQTTMKSSLMADDHCHIPAGLDTGQ